MPPIEVFAPAKINLTLHVTGQRPDGYHLLDSYVVFADVGDIVRVAPAPEMSLSVTGPMAQGVPETQANLCWRAAEAYGMPVAIELEKHLPAAAGIGGGSSDAAAVLRAMEQLFERQVSEATALALGADVPVCMVGHAAHMQGVGDRVLPLHQDSFHAALVNPRVAVSTPEVFAALGSKQNAPMTLWPESGGISAALTWLAAQRNDLQLPAQKLVPKVAEVLAALQATDNVHISRMSGSGATCFGLYQTANDAHNAAASLARAHPNWWVKAARLS